MPGRPLDDEQLAAATEVAAQLGRGQSLPHSAFALVHERGYGPAVCIKILRRAQLLATGQPLGLAEAKSLVDAALQPADLQTQQRLRNSIVEALVEAGAGDARNVSGRSPEAPD